MLETNTPSKEIYDDDNIPEIDLPKESWVVEPLPESTNPGKDEPSGDAQN